MDDCNPSYRLLFSSRIVFNHCKQSFNENIHLFQIKVKEDDFNMESKKREVRISQ